MKNNNKKIVAELARKEYRADKGRRLVLSGAVAFAVMMLFSVFSFASGKIETDMLREARMRGAVSNTTLELATQEQYQKIQGLSYIKDIGKYIQFGEALGDRAAVIDEVAWEKIKSPAFTDIHGIYPQEKTDVMLSMRTLEKMGISKPELGMELPITIGFSKERMEEFTFRLSGYYTEHIAVIIYGPPDAYFSQAFLDSVSDGEEWELTLFLRQNDNISGREVEKNLYRDVAMYDIQQRFFGEDTSLEVAMFTIAGGFDTVLVLAVVILLSAGLLIYNVLHISYERKIREYGLLKTLGTTKGQLQAIVFRQAAKNIIEGSLFGMAAGVFIALAVLPLLLSKMYLYRIGSAAGMITFRPLFLILAVFFVACVTFLSSALAIRHTMRLTPVEAVNYMEAAAGETYGGKSVCRRGISHSKLKQRLRLWQMAWRNIIRFKKRFLVSALCLALGLIVSLGVSMIFRGSDTVNQIEHDHADIVVDTQVTSWDYDSIAMDSHKKDENGIVPLIPDEFYKRLQSLSGIEECEIIRGGFGEVMIEEKTLEIYFKRLEYWMYRAVFITQIMSDEYLQKLKAFSEEQGLYLDVDSVINGEGMILMHDHQLSPTEYEMSKDMVGMPFEVYDIVNKKKVRDMRFSGYLDFEQEGLPEFRTANRVFGEDIYFLVSEKGFENIKAKEQKFVAYIEAEQGSRAVLTEEVRRLVDGYNAPFMLADLQEENPFVYDYLLQLNFDSKLDTLAEMKDYIVSNRLLLGALCGILLLMGIVNYINVTITGLTVRKKEFAVMESIGLTSRQLRRMLILEGIFFSLVITVLTAVFGSGVFWLVGKYMQERMGYFAVSYPIAEFAVCACLLFVSCSLIVLYLYRKYGEGSIALRLRIYAD